MVTFPSQRGVHLALLKLITLASRSSFEDCFQFFVARSPDTPEGNSPNSLAHILACK